MLQTIKIEVYPQVLLWARKEAGYKEQDIASKCPTFHIPKPLPAGIIE